MRGIANLVTGSRLLLAGPAFYFALRPAMLGALALTVAISGASDLVDGTIARRFDRPSKFGAALDPIADGVFYGAVAAGLAAGGAYPAWLAVLVALRYSVPVVVGAVLLRRGRLPRLRHTFFGQLSTTLIAVLLGGLALARGIGLPTGAIITAATYLFPLVTVLAWLELARTAASLGSEAAPSNEATPVSRRER